MIASWHGEHWQWGEGAGECSECSAIEWLGLYGLPCLALGGKGCVQRVSVHIPEGNCTRSCCWMGLGSTIEGRVGSGWASDGVKDFMGGKWVPLGEDMVRGMSWRIMILLGGFSLGASH